MFVYKTKGGGGVSHCGLAILQTKKGILRQKRQINHGNSHNFTMQKYNLFLKKKSLQENKIFQDIITL